MWLFKKENKNSEDPWDWPLTRKPVQTNIETKSDDSTDEEQKFDNIRFKRMTWLNDGIQLCMERATNKLFIYNTKTNTYQQIINQTDFSNLNLYGGMPQ